MMLKVFVDLMSQPCRALLIFLTVNKIPHTLHTIALRKGQNRTPEFAKLNPMQKVPVIEEDGFILTESDAILKYLSAAYCVPDHWYPQQPQKRARVDEYTAWHHMNTRLHSSKVFITEVLIPRLTGQPVDDVKLQRALRELDRTLDKLETMFLKEKDFLCGDKVTLADLLAVCELMQIKFYTNVSLSVRGEENCTDLNFSFHQFLPFHGTTYPDKFPHQPLGGGRDVLKNRPRLKEWKSRVQAALGDSFDLAHKILYTLKDKHNSKL